ncbi:MAG: VTT domain-containing protein [Litorimonas sp.]
MTVSPRWIGLFGVAAALLVIGLLFLNDVQAMLGWLEANGRSPIGLALALLLFVVGAYLLVPQWVLIGAAISTFGFVPGAAVAWTGTMLAVTVQLFTAERFGRSLRRRFTGTGLRRMMQTFRDNSLKSGFVVRLVPTGPALLVNSAAGLAGVRPGRFLVGTAFGIVPKILLTAFIVQGVISGAEGERIALWIALAALFALGQFLLVRHLRSKSRK